MVRKGNKKAASNDAATASGPVTRSRAGSNQPLDLTFYTNVKNGGNETGSVNSEGGFQVVSKRQLKQDPKNYQRLKETLSKVEQWEQSHGKPVGDVDSSQAGSKTGSNNRFVFYVTHFNLFLYATCFFIQTGTLPYLTKKLGADPVVFGQLQTAFAIAQLCGGPIYGRLGDLMGERIALVLAFTSAAISYSLMGLATSIQALFLSRGFSVLLHVMQGSQMVVTYLSEESERTSSLARLGFSYGMGMVLGPSLGGYITKNYGEQEAALVAAAGSVVSLVLVILFIPKVERNNYSSRLRDNESKDEVANGGDAGKESDGGGSVLNVAEILKLLFKPGVSLLLFLKLVSGVPIGILQSMFSIIAIERFGLAADQTGMVLSYIGAISLVMQGFGIGAVAKKFPEKSIMQFATFTLTLAYFILTLVRDVQDFMMLLLPLTCSMCLIHSIVTASLTNAVPRNSTGQMLGLNMAVHSAIRSLAPSVGGYLIAMHGLTSLGAIGIAANLVVLAITPFTKLKSHL